MKKIIEEKLKKREAELKKTNEIINDLQDSLSKFSAQRIGLNHIIMELKELLEVKIEKKEINLNGGKKIK